MPTQFFQTLHARSPELSLLGIGHFAAFVVFLALSFIDSRMLMGVGVWIKPMKFALSIGVFSWTIAWFMGYLPNDAVKTGVTWTIVATMLVEIICIAGQAARGVQSHFNVQTPFDAAIFPLMGVAITINSLAIALLAFRFFQEPLALPPAYLWGIRLGLIIFVLASFQGFMMVSRLQHNVGAPDGGEGLPFLNWSKSVGDLRVAHFIGLHAIQILPLLGLLLSSRLSAVAGAATVIAAAILYGAVCLLALLQAIAGLPFTVFALKNISKL
jgi:hypothetical protein